MNHVNLSGFLEQDIEDLQTSFESILGTDDERELECFLGKQIKKY